MTINMTRGEQKAKECIMRYALDQEMSNACPRCGGEMNKDEALNAYSRFVNAYICSTCGNSESLQRYKPFSEWYLVNLGDDYIPGNEKLFESYRDDSEAHKGVRELCEEMLERVDALVKKYIDIRMPKAYLLNLKDLLRTIRDDSGEHQEDSEKAMRFYKEAAADDARKDEDALQRHLNWWIENG